MLRILTDYSSLSILLIYIFITIFFFFLLPLCLFFFCCGECQCSISSDSENPGGNAPPKKKSLGGGVPPWIRPCPPPYNGRTKIPFLQLPYQVELTKFPLLMLSSLGTCIIQIIPFPSHQKCNMFFSSSSKFKQKQKYFAMLIFKIKYLQCQQSLYVIMINSI